MYYRLTNGRKSWMILAGGGQGEGCAIQEQRPTTGSVRPKSGGDKSEQILIVAGDTGDFNRTDGADDQVAVRIKGKG